MHFAGATCPTSLAGTSATLKITNRIARNSAAIWLTTVAGFVSQVVVVPLLLNRLGPESAGLTVALLAITTTASLVGMGLRAAVSSHLTGEISRTDHDVAGKPQFPRKPAPRGC